MYNVIIPIPPRRAFGSLSTLGTAVCSTLPIGRDILIAEPRTESTSVIVDCTGEFEAEVRINFVTNLAFRLTVSRVRSGRSIECWGLQRGIGWCVRWCSAELLQEFVDAI